MSRLLLADLSPSFSSIRDLQLAVEHDDYRSDIPTSTLRLLLQAQLPHFRDLLTPYGKPSGKLSPTAVYPGTDVKLVAEDLEAEFVTEISQKLAIDEAESLVIFKRFRRDEDAAAHPKGTLLDSVTRYHFQEQLALCELLTSLIKVAASSEDDIDALEDTRRHRIRQAAIEVLDQLASSDIIELLFKSFARAASTPAPPSSGVEMTRLWLVHYLQLQVCILESLFHYLFWSCGGQLRAETAAQLLSGIFESSFGWKQINVRQLEKLPRNQITHYLDKIEGLLCLISLEALGVPDLLLGKLTDADLRPDTIENVASEDMHMLQSSRHTDRIHAAINGASADVIQRNAFPLIVLAWAYILRRVTDAREASDDRTEDDDIEEKDYERWSSVVTSPAWQLFPKWQRILDGSLMRASWAESAEDSNARAYKESLVGLLNAVPQLIRLEYVTDLDGLNGVLCSSYGQGPGETVAPLCETFWQDVDNDASLSDLLDLHLFPYDFRLLHALRALAGVGSDVDSPTSAASQSVFDYFADLKAVGCQLPAEAMSDFSYHVTDVGTVERTNKRAFSLPGEIDVAAGTVGVQMNSPGTGEPVVLKWYQRVSGWRVLGSMLEAYVGLPTKSSTFSWSDLDLGGDGWQAGLALVDAVMRGSEELVPQVVEAMYGPAGHVQLLRVLIAGIHRANNTADVALITSILATLLPHSAGPTWQALRDSSFFVDRRSGQPGWAMRWMSSECQTGNYAATRAILRLVKRLADEIEAARYTASAQEAKQQAQILREIIHILHGNVWSTYRDWKYVDISDRTKIGHDLFDIYTTLVANAGAEVGVLQDRDLATQTLLDRLVRDAAPADFNPIMDIIRQSYLNIPNLRRSGRRQEAGASEQLLQLALRLVFDLLLLGSNIAETLCRAPKEGEHPIELLFAYIVSPNFAESSAEISAIVLQTLAPSEGSLVSALRDPKQTAHQIQELLSDATSSLSIRRQLWRFLKTSAISQPGLVSMMLDGDHSALQIAKTIVTGYEKYWESDPETLAVAIDFLLQVWRRAADTDEAFCKAVRSLALAKQLAPDLDAGETAIVRYAYQRAARACALGILAEMSDTEIISNPEDLSAIVGDAMENGCQVSLQLELNKKLEQAFGPDVWRDVSTREPSDLRRFGTSFVYDVETLRHTVLSGASDELLDLTMRSNLNFTTSVADAAFFASASAYVEATVTDTNSRTGRSCLEASHQAIDGILRERQQGALIQSIQEGRGRLLRVLLGVAWKSRTPATEALTEFVKLLSHPSFDPLDWFRNPSTALPLHRQLYPACIYAIQLLVTQPAGVVSHAFSTCTTHFVHAFALLIGQPDWSAEDGVVMVAILEALLANGFTHSAAFEAIDQTGLIDLTRNVLLGAGVDDASNARAAIVLDLHVVLAKLPMGADRLANSHITHAYCAMPVFESAARGVANGLWPVVLQVTQEILASLQVAAPFAVNECFPLLRATTAQIAADLQISVESVNIADQLDRASSMLAFIVELVDIPDLPPDALHDALDDVGTALMESIDGITIALQSPESLRSALGGIVPAEHLEAAQRACIHKLFRLSEMAVQILNASQRSASLFCGDMDAWAMSSRLILRPHEASGRTAVSALVELVSAVRDIDVSEVPVANAATREVLEDLQLDVDIELDKSDLLESCLLLLVTQAGVVHRSFQAEMEVKAIQEPKEDSKSTDGSSKRQSKQEERKDVSKQDLRVSTARRPVPGE